MTREEARRYWTARYEAARKWDDPHWEASERKEHRRYVDALNMAIEALQQVTGKLNKRDDSLLKSDSDECKEQKSKLESAEVAPKIDHDRDWIIGCLQHDGFIHTHRFDKANRIILDALSAEVGQRGEWKRVSADKYIQHAYHFYRCSKCGYDHIGKTNFCPNCGAKMKGGEQAPEIVRCKDCKHRDENCGMGEHRLCRRIKMSTTPNDFCSYGGRREP